MLQCQLKSYRLTTGVKQIMQIPSDYIEGYEKARLRDPELAARYVSHLFVGDPDADPV